MKTKIEDPAVSLTAKVELVESVEDARFLFRWITTAHCPPSPDIQPIFATLDEIVVSKRWVHNILRIYHPDKNGQYGERWRDQCTEITKVIYIPPNLRVLIFA